MATNVDWAMIRTEYETTNISQRKIAEKYNVKWETLQYRASKKKENWKKKKDNTQRQITTKLRQKTIDNIVNQKEEILKKHLEISQKFIKIIDNTLAYYNDNPVRDEKLFNCLSNSFQIMQKLQRQTLNIDIANEASEDKDKVKDFISATKQPDKNLKDLYSDENEKTK